MGEIRMNTDKSTLKELNIGEKTAQLPIIQGGMGVGISRSSLAGAVAREGGIGVISTAQIGYDEEGFEQDQAKCNRIAIGKHVKKAKEIAGGRGLVGVNIMVALKHYEEHVRESVKAGADVIISGAGLPMDLPKLVSEESGTKIDRFFQACGESDPQNVGTQIRQDSRFYCDRRTESRGASWIFQGAAGGYKCVGF